MKLHYKTVSSPKWANDTNTAINMVVEWEEFPGSMPFTACKDDVEQHGVDLYNRAVRGEFGVIEAYTPSPRIVFPTSLRNFKLALVRSNNYKLVESTIETLDNIEVSIEWQHAQMVGIDDEWIKAIQSKLPELDLQCIFTLAQTL